MRQCLISSSVTDIFCNKFSKYAKMNEMTQGNKRQTTGGTQMSPSDKETFLKFLMSSSESFNHNFVDYLAKLYVGEFTAETICRIGCPAL